MIKRIKLKIIMWICMYYGFVHVYRHPEREFWANRARAVAAKLLGENASMANVIALADVGYSPKFDFFSVRRTVLVLRDLEEGDLSSANNYELTRCVALCYGYASHCFECDESMDA